MDPVRVQKGMFLLSQAGPSDARGAYEFEPYNYGPCSFALYRDLDALEAQGLIEGTVVPGYTWKHYELTPRGRERAGSLASEFEPADIEQVKRIRDFVSTRSFRRLLTDVYRQFPEYTENSVVSSLRPQ